jgi:hypothetical protein
LRASPTQTAGKPPAGARPTAHVRVRRSRPFPAAPQAPRPRMQSPASFHRRRASRGRSARRGLLPSCGRRPCRRRAG